MISSFRPEQFKARDAINLYVQALRRTHPKIPIHRLEMEYEIREWKIFGVVDGIELKGMPTLDLALFFDKWPLKIAIELNGEYHRTRTVQDENRAYVLTRRWGPITIFDKDFNSALWGTDRLAMKEDIEKHLKPILVKNMSSIFRPSKSVPR